MNDNLAQESNNSVQEATIFKDDGTMRTDYSLAFYEKVEKDLEGQVIKLEAQRGKPDLVFNTKLFTDRNEEIWLSGFTCGKPHAGSLGLCELIVLIGWDHYVPRDQIARIVLSNNSFRMEFKADGRRKKVFLIDSRHREKKLWIPGQH